MTIDRVRASIEPSPCVIHVDLDFTRSVGQNQSRTLVVLLEILAMWPLGV
jgi:hypothetical protein